MFSRTLKRKLESLTGDTVREALRVAWDFATLGEATPASDTEPQTAPTVEHPHRRPLARPARHGRPGTVVARPQVCRTPLSARSSRPTMTQRLTTEHR